MKLITPNYYQKFKCIADRCRHNCCIGWEIDIDEETDAYYRGLQGSMGARLQKSVSRDGTPHFILGNGERCPFLNEKNLCDIITELGEEHLCQICTDHPRFRNEFSDRIELGLGLCCEEACSLILSQKEPFSLMKSDATEYQTEEEQTFFSIRDRIFQLLQNRTQPMEKRLSHLLDIFHIELPDLDWRSVFFALERLDPVWDTKIQKIDLHAAVSEDWSLPLEQLAVYFIHRHLAGALEDGRYAERCAFAVLSVKAIASVAASVEDLPEIARLYSSEIEYSDKNIDLLLDKLTQG